ncbi:MAG: 2-oxoglutarate dehydrogenase complex dihydrolipoyllysine-residue succinyltransferase [Bacteroidia bacterium]|jgi:2-oxoglutarate dehydrogenase E2 component (dihydrolipoamide succinyltransferase)|nr:2-oxoglutarate dehydrogenase complex dihydrolipoyllysine-residue succinyltransferase [Bacteroidia bacterium]MBP9180929.1 2-oxoglutarate dehydrogenase complex dihydrolipoyllysine-residue succinyltransferase [Bacteroidia bacterium]MBP9725024.1 2-oxoglutarate dehydrogenase complex dihydrolipoyllysine-residue succinyltransferase [Bacteroidia bacterium]
MALEIKVPTVGESISEVTISRWLKKDGDWVEMDEVLAELESDKATFELNAEKAGVLKTLGKEGDNIAVGAVICSIDTDAPRPAGAQAKEEKKAEAPKAETPSATPAKTEEKTYANGTPSPAAGKILAEKGIDPASVEGSGKGGRITKADALAASPLKTGLKSTVETVREARLEKMTNLRKTVAKRLVAAKNETAMLTTFNEVDMKPIMDLRAKYKDKFKEKHGVNLGFMSFFTKAVCEALQAFPAVNSYIHGEEIEYHNYCDISIAVSAPKGLVVPVIRNAESMSLADIEKAVGALAAKARDNKLTLEEMSGGTFTITNGGVFGSMMSTPIINPPQSAILGMHNIVERPVVRDGQIVIRPMMYVALSYDHRIIDGRESVGFLVRVKNALENPVLLLTGGKDPNSLILDL